MLRYIELKTGYNDNGPAWIGRVKLSKSGRTVYFNGHALKQGARDQSRFVVSHEIRETDPARFVELENEPL